MTDKGNGREDIYLGGSPTSLFLVVSGPGGTGKSTLIQRWLREDATLGYVRNYTTRVRRPVDPASGIDDGDWFHFVSAEDFKQKVRADFFAQWVNPQKGYASGTPLAPLLEAIEEDRDLVFDYTPQLYLNLRRRFRRQVVGVFLVPPTLAELRRRLQARNADTGAKLELKLQMGVQDLAFMDEHDYVVVNDDPDHALAQLAAIRTAEKCRIERQRGMVEAYDGQWPHSMLFYYDPAGERLARIDPE